MPQKPPVNSLWILSGCHRLCLLSGRGHPVTVTEEGGLLNPSPHRLLEDFRKIEPLWCQEAKAYFIELTLNYRRT